MSNNYKDSLLMPQTEFEMRANLNQKEPKIQDFWLNNSIYQKMLSKNNGNKKFTLHDGPPYANGNLHVGHALNKILKDFIIRYKTSKGYYTNFIAGWDTHGLPIENAISKIDKDFETSDMSPNEKRHKCREYALSQVEKQKSQFRRLGVATDFAKTYLTLEHNFVMNELKLFKTMVEKNLVFQDFKPVYWSWSTRCALAEAEIEYANSTSPSIYVAFKLIDVDASLVIWTTTPWTIPSNLAIAVNPDIDYAFVSVNNNTYIISSNLLDSVAKELGWNDYKINKIVKGTELENLKYKHPWIDRISPVILAEYVSNEGGTGLVHNAPGFGQDDYYACKKYGINVYCPIDDFGKFTKEINDLELEGVFYIKANDIILNRLMQSNSLLKASEIVHSVAHDWRTHKPIIYRATKQWFVNISKIKEQINNSLKNDVSSLNAKTINRIIEMIENRYEWCISRQRVWGVPIPIIFDKDKNPIYDLKLIDHILSVIDRDGVDIWFEKDASYFIPDWMDKTKTYYKEKDIIDVWFDSGSSFNVLFENQLNYPADLYLEGSDQFRGWFNSSAINGTIQNGHVPYKFLLQHGFVLDEQGLKMSKSKGNTIDPMKVCEEQGADILRLWVASSEYNIDLRFGQNILKQVSENYKKIRNTLLRYTISNLHDFNYDQDFTYELRLEDYYVLSQLKKVIKQIDKAYEEYSFIDVTKLLMNFTNDLSQWYFDIIKDALYCESKNSIVRKQIQSTLYVILKSIIVVLYPILPHTCEELYQIFNKDNKKESIALELWPELNELDELNNEQNKLFDDFFNLKDKVYQALEKARQEQIIKKNNEATVFVRKEIGIKEQQLAKWLNVAEVIYTDNDNIQVLNNNYDKCLRCWNHYNKKDMANNEVCTRCYNVLNSKNYQ